MVTAGSGTKKVVESVTALHVEGTVYEDSGRRHIKLLLIDDDPDIIETVSMVLKNEGFEVFGALSGEEGIALARAERPDIIVLDVEMPPGIGGPEVCRRIRSDPDISEMPVIFLTGKVDIDAMEATLEEDAQGYLLKPFSALDLLDKLNEVFGPNV